MEKEKSLLDEILEEHAQQQRIEMELSREAGEVIQGLYSPKGIYNIPRKTNNPTLGKTDWGALCDHIGCLHKNKDLHIHTVGIGIAGAQKIMTIYGGLEIDPEEPHIVKGEGGEELWACKVNGFDTHNKNKFSRTFMQSAVIESTNGKKFKNEYTPMIVQSKAIREVILFLVPGDIKQKWVEQYAQAEKASANGRKEDNNSLFAKVTVMIDGCFTVAELDKWQKTNAKKISDSPNKDRIEDYIKQKRLDLTIDALAKLTGYDMQIIAGFVNLADETHKTAIADAVRGDADAIKELTEYLANYKASLEKQADDQAAAGEEVEGTADQEGQTEMAM